MMDICNCQNRTQVIRVRKKEAKVTIFFNNNSAKPIAAANVVDILGLGAAVFAEEVKQKDPSVCPLLGGILRGIVWQVG